MTENKKEKISSLSMKLVDDLLGLAKKLGEKEVTPESVNASCNVAIQVHRILETESRNAQ